MKAKSMWTDYRSIYCITLMSCISLSSHGLSKKTPVNEYMKILFLGDSLTAGYGVEKVNAYPELVKNLLATAFPKKKIEILNGGISGSTSQSGLSRLKWQIKAKPTHLFIALGANDGLRGQPPKNLAANLGAMIKFAKETNLKVMLAGMKVPPNYGSKYTNEFEGAYQSVVKKHHVAFLDFLLEGVAGDPTLNQADGIHPNEEGHKKLAKHVFEFMRKHIK